MGATSDYVITFVEDSAPTTPQQTTENAFNQTDAIFQWSIRESALGTLGSKRVIFVDTPNPLTYDITYEYEGGDPVQTITAVESDYPAKNASEAVGLLHDEKAELGISIRVQEVVPHV